MNLLKKTILTASSLFIINQASSQTLKYDARCNLFNAKLGNMEYSIDNRKLTLEIDKFIKVYFTYHMPNDSTYIEVTENEDVAEEFVYSKKDSSWCLESYTCLKGKPRQEKTDLGKIEYDTNIITPIETLENVLNNDVSDSTKVIIMGLPYTIIISEKNINNVHSNYKGNIRPFHQDKTDNFILEDGLEINCEKKGKMFIPKSLDATTKILQIFPIGARVRLEE